ncbi:MAG: hypothetical protein KDB36_11600, partial [Acidimicrobiales bacterium]|nr:hypothetical protein [Acidimicrobiales bacterium]
MVGTVSAASRRMRRRYGAVVAPQPLAIAGHVSGGYRLVRPFRADPGCSSTTPWRDTSVVRRRLRVCTRRARASAQSSGSRSPDRPFVVGPTWPVKGPRREHDGADAKGDVMRQVLCRELGPPEVLVVEEAPDLVPGA